MADSKDDRSRFVMPLDQVRIAGPGDPVLEDKDVEDEDASAPGSEFAPPRGPHMRSSGGIVP